MRLRLVVLAAAGLLLGVGLGVLRPDAVRLIGGDAVAAGHDALAAPGPVAAETTPAGPPEAQPHPEPVAEQAIPEEPAPAPPLLPSPSATPVLVARLAGLLDGPAMPADDRLGVTVLDAHGRVVFDHNGDAALMPASTQKLLVAAAGLVSLGPEFRFRTQVRAGAPPDEAGVVGGDLLVVGGGDPMLASPAFIQQVVPDRPHTPLADLADQLVEAGVRHVTGAVVGDPTVFTDQPLPSGWLDRYLADLDGLPVSGLTVDGGRRMFVRDGRLIGEAAADPAAEAAAALVVLLGERGVTVAGGPAATRQPPSAPVPLAAVESRPLIELLRYMVQRSDNGIADSVLRAVGATGGDSSWAGAAAATQRALAPLRLDWDGAVIADGSGLSRDNRVTARTLASLDQRMTSSNLGATWQHLMAVSGESGTLRRRLLGSVAERRLRGKTGSLKDVRSLSGVVVGPEGSRYHFAVVGNGLEGDMVAAVRALQDELVLVLAEDLYGCVPVPVPPPEGDEADGAPAEQMFVLQCAH